MLSKNAAISVNDAVTAQGGNVKATAKTGLTVNDAVQGYINVELGTGAGGIAVNKQVTSSIGDISMTAGEGLVEIGDNVEATNGNVTVHVDKGTTSTDDGVDAIAVRGNINAGQTVSLTAGEGSIGIGVGATETEGKVDAAGDITIRSDKGEIDVYNSVTSTGGNISISNGEEAIYVQGAVTASGNVNLTSEKGLIDIDSAVTSQDGNISATSQGNMTIDGAVIAKKDVTLLSKNAAISVNDAVTTQAGDITATAKENIAIGASITASAGNVEATSTTGDILVSGDITVGANKDVLLETKQGDIYVGTFIDNGQTVSANGSIGAANGNTAGTVTVKTGEGTIDILKSIASTNTDVENGNGDIIIGINKPSAETVTAKENISLVTKQGQIEIYGKTSTDDGDITMKAAADSYNTANPESAFIIGQYGQVASGRDITLEARNGDIHITDDITAKQNVNATVKDKGSLYFDNNLSVDGDITANVAEGNIEVGAAVTSSEGNVSLQTGTGNIDVSGDITVGANKDVLLETKQGDIFVGTFTDDGQTVSANGSIGAADGNTAGTVTVKTGEGTIDILKSIASTNIDVENGNGDIIIGVNKPSAETVTAKENISLVTKQGQIEIYGKTSTDDGDITMKAAADSYNTANPESAFVIGQYGQVASGRDITLEGRNGDIHISDEISAKRNMNAVIGDKGSLYFDENLRTAGAVAANVAEGNIEVGAAVTSGDDVSLQTGTGNIEVGAAVISDEGEVSLQTGTGNIEVGAAVTAKQDVTLQAGSGKIDVEKEVKSDLGAISVTTGNGNIHIGNNGPTVETVTAAGDVTLATELGKVTVSGKTSSKNGDVTLSAKSAFYTPGDDGMNIIIENTGRVEAAKSVHLNAGEGDLHISDRVSSGKDLTAKVEGQGSLSFDTDIDVKGTIGLETTNGNIDVGHDVTAGESVQMQTGTGYISVGSNVTAKTGDIQAHVGQGDITIGDNDPTVETVTAQKNIRLTTDEGKIYIYGKTSTKEEDIHLAAANKTYNEGEDRSPIIIDQNGVIDSGRSVSLQGGNGDIYVTDDIKSAMSLDVRTVTQGNIYFESSVDSKGSISAQTDSGNITAGNLRAVNNIALSAGQGDVTFNAGVAKNTVSIQIGNGNLQADSIISNQSIRTETGRGDTNITLADAANVSILMGDNTNDSSIGTIRANATGGVSDVALGGNYISAGTVEAKNGGQYLVVFTQGATRGQAGKDISIGAIRSSGGTIMPQVWSETGSIYVAEGYFHASKVYAMDNLRFANDKVSVTQYAKPDNFDKNTISYFNNTSKNRPQDLLTDWFSGSYSDRRWLSVDLDVDGSVRTRFGKLINSNGYGKLDADSSSMSDQMSYMLDRWFSVGSGLVYFDRYGLILYNGLVVNDDTNDDELVVNN